MRSTVSFQDPAQLEDPWAADLGTELCLPAIMGNGSDDDQRPPELSDIDLRDSEFIVEGFDQACLPARKTGGLAVADLEQLP
jgi:hypothetical protein